MKSFFSLVCFILICSDIFLIPCQKDMKLHAGVLKLAASSWYTRGRTCSNYEYKEVASTADHLHLLLLSPWAWRVQTWAQLWSCPPPPLWGPHSSHNRLTTLLFKYIHFTWKTTATPGRNVLSQGPFSLMMFFMVHLLFRKKNRARSDRNEEWEGEAVRLIWTRNIMSTSYTLDH